MRGKEEEEEEDDLDEEEDDEGVSDPRRACIWQDVEIRKCGQSPGCIATATETALSVGTAWSALRDDAEGEDSSEELWKRTRGAREESIPGSADVVMGRWKQRCASRTKVNPRDSRRRGHAKFARLHG